jgi:uncharacterized membrane protein
MAQTQQLAAPQTSRASDWQPSDHGPLRQFMHHRMPVATADGAHGKQRNVSDGERMVSVAAGAILAGLGLARRDWTGLAIAGVGGAMLYRGATGHSPVYQTLGIDTAEKQQEAHQSAGVHIVQSFQIGKSAEELYSFWRNFENLPRFMEHLEAVTIKGDRTSHWVAKAPLGMKAEWDA